MTDKFSQITAALEMQLFSKDISCFLVFGSGVFHTSGTSPQDTDVCVVVKNRNADLQSITEFIFKHFNGPDYRIYFEDEVFSSLPFMDKGVGTFSLEYFSDGICLHGNNIFVEKLNSIDEYSLKQSYLNKIFEYIIRIREVRYSLVHDGKYKLWHIQKYLSRLIIDMLLYKNIIKYKDIKKYTRPDILTLAQTNNFFDKSIKIDYDSSNNLYLIYEQINEYLIRDFLKK